MAKEQLVPFDYLLWRQRLSWTKEQAASALGVSRTYYWKIEKHGRSNRMCAWAAYGLEVYSVKG